MTAGVRVVADNQKQTIEAVNCMAQELRCPSVLVDTYHPEIQEPFDQGEMGDLFRSLEYLKRRLVKGEEGSRQAIDAAVKSRVDKLLIEAVSTKNIAEELIEVADKVEEITEDSYFALGSTANSFEESIHNATRQADIAVSNSISRLESVSESVVKKANGKIAEMREFSDILESVGGMEGFIKQEHQKVLSLLDSVIYEAASAEGRAELMNTNLLAKIREVVSKVEAGIAPLDEKIDAIKAQVNSKLNRLNNDVDIDTTNTQTQPVTEGRRSRRK
ncbi:MAG: hypothetical protein HRT63_11565 [Erythrobacter sp.]|nr:hypothetical protein [Erythrobacter sp.]